MDADQRPMSPDATIDRELQALLAADPSAEFVARVRTRIADDPERAAWWLPRLAVITTVAAAVVIVAFGVAHRVSERLVTERSAKDVALHQSEPVKLLESQTLPSVLPVGPVRRVQPLRPVLPPPEPDILIDAREALALRSLMRRASDGRVDLQSIIASTTPQVMDVAPLRDVSIEPIVIVPLEEGARQ